MFDFQNLKIDCDNYNKNKKIIEIELLVEDISYTWGYTPFETFSKVISCFEKPKRLVVYGCSIGYQCFFWNYLFPEVPVVGIDLLNDRVNWGKSKIEEYGIKNVELITGDIINFEIEDGDLIWQNDLLIPDDFIYEITLYNLSNYDVKIISYKDISYFHDGNLFTLTDEIIIKDESYYKISQKITYGVTSWKNDSKFFIYVKNQDEIIDDSKSKFGVDFIKKEYIVSENNLSSYHEMNFSKRNVVSDELNFFYNKHNAKIKFIELGFNVPQLYFYSNVKCDIKPLLSQLDSFVAKPVHFSESIDVFIKKNSKSYINIDDLNQRLNKRIDISDKRNWRRNPIDVDIYWKNTERGIIVEEYINVIYELKVFVVFGEPVVADLRTGNTELYTIDFIRKDNKYLNWDKEYDIITEFAKILKIDFFRIDFLYDGDKLYASELTFMPGTYLPENIENFILKKWRQPYFEHYYPHLC